MAISIILIYLGYQYDDVVLKSVGFWFIVILSFSTIGNGLEYHSGDLINKTIIDNVVVTKQYETYSLRTISIFLIVVGLVGATFSIYYDYDERRRSEE